MLFTEEDVIREYNKTRSATKVARNLGLGIRDVLPFIDKFNETRMNREEVHGGWGRPEMRQFVVARKRVTDTWSNDDPQVAAARAAYETGSHNMATGRDGDWLILYSIPNRKVVPRPGYFHPEF